MELFKKLKKESKIFLKKSILLILMSHMLFSLDIKIVKEKVNVAPIILAIKAQKYNNFKQLFDKNKLHKRYAQNQTLLHYASFYNNQKVAKLLVNKGASLNALGGGYVETPLHSAIRYGNLKLAVYLIKHKSDLTLKDKYGETALKIAKRLNYMNIYELLKQYGAIDKSEQVLIEKENLRKTVNKYKNSRSINPYKTNINALKVELRHNIFESENTDKNNNNLLGEKNSQIEIGN